MSRVHLLRLPLPLLKPVLEPPVLLERLRNGLEMQGLLPLVSDDRRGSVQDVVDFPRDEPDYHEVGRDLVFQLGFVLLELILDFLPLFPRPAPLEAEDLVL